MKLSIAIVAGIETLRFTADPDYDVFGAAASAVGLPRFGVTSEEIMAQRQATLDYWLWLVISIHVPGEDCIRSLMEEIEYRFDQHFCAGYTSLNHLLDYIREIEPGCSCKCYNCVCDRVAPLLHDLEHELILKN
jgi:hypothetical protein